MLLLYNGRQGIDRTVFHDLRCRIRYVVPAVENWNDNSRKKVALDHFSRTILGLFT